MSKDNSAQNSQFYIQKEDPFKRSKFYMNFVRPVWEYFLSWIFPIPIISKLITWLAISIVFPAGQGFFKGMVLQSIGNRIKENIREEIRKKTLDPEKEEALIKERIEKLHEAIKSNASGKKMCQTFDGAEIWGDEIRAGKEGAPTMLAFQGNGFFYELSSDLARKTFGSIYVHENIAKELGANLVTFNYRGVMHSTGKAISHTDLVVDGLAMVDMLIKRGDKKIILCGHSLGGTVAARVMDYFLNNEEGKKKLKDNGVELFYVADRSLKRTDMFVPAPLRIIVKPILMIAGFEIDIEKEIAKMPSDKRIVIESRIDEVIPSDAHIGTILDKNKKGEVVELIKGHCTEYSVQEDGSGFAKVTSTIKEKFKFTDIVEKSRQNQQAGLNI